jgi:hypothetical protein
MEGLYCQRQERKVYVCLRKEVFVNWQNDSTPSSVNSSPGYWLYTHNGFFALIWWPHCFVRSPSLSYLLAHSRCRGVVFALDHTQAHTTLGRTPLDERSARRKYLYLTTQTLYKTKKIHAPGGIRTRNPSKRAAADPRLRPRGHWDRPLACWDCGFESCRGHGCLSLVSVVCCQVEVSAIGWSLTQRSPTECGVSECDSETPIMRRRRPTGGGGNSRVDCNIYYQQ